MPAPHIHPQSSRLVWRIGGMDCASCITKIEAALARQPGISDIQLNFASEKLELTLNDSSPAKAADITALINTLGFTATQMEPEASPTEQPDTPHWWQTNKGRQVILLGVLMATASAIALLLPTYKLWAFALAVIIGVLPFARQALALAKSGSPFSIEMLMSVAAIGALLIGEAEEAAAVVFLFSLGELLESLAANRARAGIRALVSLLPKTALLLDAQGQTTEVPAASLQTGSLILLRPGDRVAADGLIVDGSSSLNEAAITGESMPRNKTTGDPVFAGAVNLDGVVKIRVEKTGSDNTITRIIHLVEQAQTSKAPTARFIERFSHYYTPAVMLLAALVVLVPPLVAGGDWGQWLYRGLALLLIACPCALVLSTPAAIASGLAAGTRRGLLVKGGHALETIGKVTTIAFDKTGTLTAGRPEVTDLVSFGALDEQQLLALCASLETGSSHPLALAIRKHAAAAGLDIPAASQAFATAGKAVHARVNGQALALASPLYATAAADISSEQNTLITNLQQQGKTVSVLLDEDRRTPLGIVALRDEPRADAQQGIASLHALGLRCVLLTGDNRRTAAAIAGQLGIDYHAELLPEDKLVHIKALQQQGQVAMVGDGINDAPALASADIGIAMGGGTDVALETADAAMMNNRVTDVAQLVALSRATLANIHQNVMFALGLKALFLLTTLLGLTGLWMAVLADTGATALVTLNALRLLRFRGH